MDALTSELIKALGSGAMSQIGKSVGADKKSTESALTAALPVPSRHSPTTPPSPPAPSRSTTRSRATTTARC